MRARATTGASSASPAPGTGEEYYATGQSNVTGLMIDQQGRLLAGTEPNGILYRITAKDKAFVLYDSSLPEIRAVAPNAGWQHLCGRRWAERWRRRSQAAQQANQARSRTRRRR